MSRYHDGKALKNRAHNSLPLPADGVGLETFIPWRYVRRTCRKEVITPLDAPEAFVEEAKREQKARKMEDVSPLQRALGLAHHWQRLLDEHRINSVADIARTEDLDITYVRRLLRLVLLAPDIIEFLLMNKQVTLERMRKPLPLLWTEQKRQLEQLKQPIHHE